MNIRGKNGIWYNVPDHVFGDRDGRTFVRGLDRQSLDTEAGLTWIFMTTHEWVTPQEVAEGIGWDAWDHGSVTARIRDLRKLQFGSYTVLRRRREMPHTKRLHEYRLMDPVEGVNEIWPDTRPSGTPTARAATTEVPSPSRPTSTRGWRIAPSSP